MSERRAPTPLVAIVGRPNVGKSTLFNRLVPGRPAVVDDAPGTTRDRHYGRVEHVGRTFLLVDTGGFEARTDDPLFSAVRAQTELAIEEADAVVWVGDARDGLLGDDRAVIDRLRRSGKPVLWTVNKADNESLEADVWAFSEAGIDPILPLSTAHGRGVDALCDAILEALPGAPALAAADGDAADAWEEDDEEDAGDDEAGGGDLEAWAPDGDAGEGAAPADEPAPAGEPAPTDEAAPVRIAIVGRPNVGKSSLVNALLGVDRHLVADAPGTTVDAIDSELVHDGRTYVLVDTAGMRRKRSIASKLEHYAVLRTLRAVESADVAVLVADAVSGVVDQDAHILGAAVDAGRGIVVALNRWDLQPPGEEAARAAVEQARGALAFAPWAPVLRCSALTGKNVRAVLEHAARVRREWHRRVPTGQLNRAFAEIVQRHAPPAAGNRRVRLYYITQVATAPPSFVVSANYPKDVHFSYRRYLQNKLRERFGFEGVPLRVFYRPRRERDAAPSRPSRT